MSIHQSHWWQCPSHFDDGNHRAIVLEEGPQMTFRDVHGHYKIIRVLRVPMHFVCSLRFLVVSTLPAIAYAASSLASTLAQLL